jgi:hypothetical protein
MSRAHSVGDELALCQVEADGTPFSLEGCLMVAFGASRKTPQRPGPTDVIGSR